MLPGVDLEQLLIAGGLLILFAIVFAESGLFFGFFLPGDSLLLTAGVLSAKNPDSFPIWLVCGVCFIAAISGDAVGYTFGKRVGGRLYERPDSRFFKRSHLEAAMAFYEKHGGKTIVISRFLPIVRTFAPIVAGTARMPYPRFALFNFLGAAIWAIGVPVAGYILGRSIPADVLDRYLYLIIAGVVALSFLPTLIHLYRHNREEVHARVRSRGRRGAERPVQTLPDEPVGR
jgi:membrane-associated protein